MHKKKPISNCSKIVRLANYIMMMAMRFLLKVEKKKGLFLLSKLLVYIELYKDQNKQ